MTSCLVISEEISRQGECQNFASLNIRLEKDASPFLLTEGLLEERHLPLSEQFREVADTARGVIQWLKHNTIVKVVKEPLLP